MLGTHPSTRPCLPAVSVLRLVAAALLAVRCQLRASHRRQHVVRQRLQLKLVQQICPSPGCWPRWLFRVAVCRALVACASIVLIEEVARQQIVTQWLQEACCCLAQMLAQHAAAMMRQQRGRIKSIEAARLVAQVLRRKEQAASGSHAWKNCASLALGALAGPAEVLCRHARFCPV